MCSHMLQAWGMMLLLGLTITAPLLADEEKAVRGRLEQDGPMAVRILRPSEEGDDVAAYRQWFGFQVRDYGDVDPNTGERIGNLLLMITDVDRDSMTVTNQRGQQQLVVFTTRTELTFVGNRQPRIEQRRGPARHGNNDPLIGSRLESGDLVVLEGYLRNDASFVAARIRVYGHSNYWGGGHWGQPAYGFRAYGEVRMVDTRRNRIEVNTNIGRRTVTLARDGDVVGPGAWRGLDALRAGDRVVLYYRNEDVMPLEAYHIVVLQPRQAYPDGDNAYWADPAGNNGNDDTPDNMRTEDGRLDHVIGGVLLNTIVLRTEGNRTFTVRAPKSLQAITRNGDQIELTDLRDGSRLRISYYEVAGAYFAGRIEVR